MPLGLAVLRHRGVLAWMETERRAGDVPRRLCHASAES